MLGGAIGNAPSGLKLRRTCRRLSSVGGRQAVVIVASVAAHRQVVCSIHGVSPQLSLL